MKRFPASRPRFSPFLIERLEDRRLLSAVGTSTADTTPLLATTGTTVSATAATTQQPSILLTQADFDRIAANVNAGKNPWLAGWNLLTSDGYSQTGWTARPLTTVIRGGTGENFNQMIIDIQRAFQTAIRWKISGNTAYADQAVSILNAWSSTMTTLTGNSDRFLASGLYGYDWAITADIMRSYSGWADADVTKFQDYLVNIYYPMQHDFLVNHNTAYITNYWANWDLANLEGMMSIGLFTGRQDLYDEAMNYLYTGGGNGALDKIVYYMHPGHLGQWQESGRDQGHSVLGMQLFGHIAQMAWNQGDDLFSYNNDQFLAAAEYIAKYNLGNDVPYVTYSWGNGQSGAWSTQTAIGSGSRGDSDVGYELIYAHYAGLLGMAAPYSAARIAARGTEGRGSGDDLGFGTLLFAQDLPTTPQVPSGLTAIEKGNGNVELDWFGGLNNTSYKVYRSTSANGTYALIASGITDLLTYTDRNLAGGTYYYKVTGVSASGETAASNIVSATSSNQLQTQLLFDENTGTTAGDATGNGYTGTLNNGATWATGKSGSALSLDGVDDYVSLPTGTAQTLGDFTIASWVYLNASQTWARIFDFGDSRGRWMFLTPKNSSGKVEFSTSTTYGYNKQSVIGTAALPTNQWVHIAVTFADRTATLYVNGVAVGSNSNMDFPPFEIGSTTNNWIGRSQYSSDPYLNGKVDDFRIYRGALKAGEMYTLATGLAAPAVPAAPATLTATAVAGNQINLSWASVSGATGYTVKRATTSGGPYTTIATLLTGTTYSDTGRTAGTTYYYIVNATNNGGESAASPQASAVALPPMPGTPTSVVAKGMSTTTVGLTWTAASDAASYTVRRATTAGGPYTVVATGVTGTSYTNTGLTNGTTYYYVVTAVNAAGESAFSTEVSATPSDLYLLLRMDETTGTTAADSSGNAQNAILVNGPTLQASGKLGSAVQLDGVDDYLSLPTGVTSSLTAVTIAAWVNLDTISQWSRIFDFGTGTTNYMFLSPKGGSNVIRFAMRTASVSEQQINGTAALTAGAWTHVAVTLSGTVGVLYVNGVEVGRNSAMTLSPASLGSTTQNYIGKSQFADPYLKGRVDDFRIYGRVLSAAEVSTLASAVIPAQPTGLTATGGNQQVSLSWTAATGASSYTVQRATVSGGPYTTVASNLAGTSYVDTAVTNQTTYYYVVYGSSMAGDGPASAEVSAVSDAPPTIATAAAASPSTVTGKTTALSVLGDDDGGEANIIYTWSLTGTPPAAVTYSVNGTNDAKTTVATFSKAGTYNFLVTITDGASQSVTSSVSVTVVNTLTSVAVSPATFSIAINGTKTFTATGLDQFGVALASQPAFNWSAANGSITSAGLYTAPAAAGTDTVTASSGGVSGTAAVTVTGLTAPPTVATAASATPNPLTGTTATLSVLGADDGGEPNLKYSWSVTGTPPATVFFAANGTNAAKSTTATFTKAGTYNLLAMITDAEGQSVTSAVTVTVSGLFTAATKVGTFSPTPSASVSSGTYTVTGAGSLSTGTSTDNFYYYNTQVSGDADLIARVVSMSSTNSAARGGIMVRNSTANNSVYSGLFMTGSSTVSSAVRTAAGISTGTTVSGTAVPYWLKISRRGTTLTTYRSSDGVTWTQVRSDTISSLGTTAYFGLVASRSSGSSNTVKFDNVSLVKVAAPTIATPAAISPRPVAGTTATLSALGASYAGESGLIYTWATTGTPPAAVGFSANGTNAAKTTTATFTAPGTYNFQVTIKDAAGLTTTSSVTATVTFGMFGTSVDIGSPALAGSLAVAGSTYTLKGGGADVWGTSDQFRYAYNSLAGDGTIVARVTGTTNTNVSAKAGVMFRDSAAANAAYAYVWVSPGNQAKFETRTANGGSSAYSVASATLTGSVWVKLVRSSTTSFTAYYSSDGSTWTQLGTTQTITMAGTALVGLAVTSHNTASLNTASFDNVAITPAAPMGMAVNAGSAQRSNVTSLTLSFNQVVNLGSSDLQLARRSTSGGTATPVTDFVLTTSDGGLTYVLSFTGSNYPGNSITDGIYDLTALGTRFTFHRLFGDQDGDGDVDSVDSLRFKQSQNTVTGQTAYHAWFDADGDGDIDAADAAAFKLRQGTLYSY